ncbi:MAG TPA: type I-U CRISPR-associated protein Csb2 [Myxococcota bacterium]|nr:type I-U CRISPR-associated protein Csb2 [Myxococcota bacterium]HQK52308.1 type I-U CRISPR-associated protein Csb2 [Myxococcota bacterium]
MFAIAWQYLTGRAVATSPSDRTAPEWPPHPDRVFMALVASWADSGAPPAGRAALEWLEAQTPPSLVLPQSVSLDVQDPTASVIKVFVPVNDIEPPKRGREYGDTYLGLLPSRREKKERHFPSVLPGEEVCMLVFREPPPLEHRAALASLCSHVVRIGHSRSLVRVWLEDNPPDPLWIPNSPAGADFHLRVPYKGRLADLQDDFNMGVRPRAARWIAYGSVQSPDLPRGEFDGRMFVFRRTGGAQSTISRTLAWTDALRGVFLKAADGNRDWMQLVSGHSPDGGRLNAPHVAFVPLANTGHSNATGLLMGFGLLLPATLSPDQQNAFLYDVLPRAFQDADPPTIRLVAGALGEMFLERESQPVPAFNLRSTTWTRQGPRWATVTPIVLDRQPPRRHEDQDQWAMDQIADACRRQGLPEPLDIAVSGFSSVPGVPPARAFPPLPRRSDGGRRWHLHATIRFPRKIAGPLLLGAGRYRGYGLLRPWEVP